MSADLDILPASIGQHGIAIFPCLKTSAPVKIGSYTFRSTDDVEGLPTEHAETVAELATMLYAQGDVRIKSAVYAITEPLGVFRPGPVIQRLDRIRAVVGYLYGSPHPTFGDTFMPYEFASMAVLQPAAVSRYLVRPEHGTILPPLPQDFVEDKLGYTPGYEGILDNKSIWLTKYCRIYGDRAHTPLNISQDLWNDIQNSIHDPRSAARFLLDLLNFSETPFSERIFTAVDWYNQANKGDDGPDKKLLSLAIAFETLLELPSSEKTDRLADGIALLLGRTFRLKEWALQFYSARSQVAHEGRVKEWRFYSSRSNKKAEDSHMFGSVMTFGFEIFRLCLVTILTGAELASHSGLAGRFVANSERFMQIHDLLASSNASAEQKIIKIKPIVDELDRYQFIFSPLPVSDVIKSLRIAVKVLDECKIDMCSELKSVMKALLDAPKKDDYAALAALEALNQAFRDNEEVSLGDAGAIVAKLVSVGWRELFMIYHHTKSAREVAKPEANFDP